MRDYYVQNTEKTGMEIKKIQKHHEEKRLSKI